MKKIVFDSHAILTWMQAEKGHHKVKSLITSCKSKKMHGYMSQINLGEVYYKTIRVIGLTKAKKYLESFYLLPLEILLPTSDIIWSASEIKAKHSISYADCFTAATALSLKASIVTGDKEFKKLAKIISIEWI